MSVLYQHPQNWSHSSDLVLAAVAGSVLHQHHLVLAVAGSVLHQHPQNWAHSSDLVLAVAGSVLLPPAPVQFPPVPVVSGLPPVCPAVWNLQYILSHYIVCIILRNGNKLNIHSLEIITNAFLYI